MKTKTQKSAEIKQSETLLAGAQSIVFTDFTGTAFESLKKLKTELKKTGSTFKVTKKRLLKVALKNKGVDMDPTQFDAQVGAIYIPGDLSTAAGAVYKFAKEMVKEKKEFKILGAYDMTAKSYFNLEAFTVIAKLPSREVLLGQLVGMLAAPIRQFMFVLDQISKKSAPAGQPVETK